MTKKKAKPATKRNAPVAPGIYPRDGWFKAVVRGTVLKTRFTKLAEAVKARAEFLAKLDKKQAVAA